MATFWKIENGKEGKGKGKRGVIYIKGCYEHCIDCPYPENYTPQWNFAYYAEKCTDCGECVALCPYGCHLMKEGKHILDRTLCINCNRCTSVCDALEKVGFDMSGTEAYELVKCGNDGITVSGGEPFYQFEPMMEILRSAKADGKNTAVETFGNICNGQLETAIPFVDEFLFTHKVAPKDYAGFTMTDYDKPQKSLDILDKADGCVTLRCTLIPGINDTEEYISSIIDNVKAHRSVKKIDILPYKATAEKRGKDLGIVPGLAFNEPTNEELSEFAERVKNSVNIPVNIIL